MNSDVEFQMVCSDCGSLAIKIEDPISASRETIVCCSDCGAARGTVGALRDLALRPDAQVLPARPRVLPPRQRPPEAKSSSELVSLHKELQSLRRKAQQTIPIVPTEG
jgi:hypothetical protein